MPILISCNKAVIIILQTILARTKKTIIYRPPEIVSFEEKVTTYAELHP